MPEGPEIRRAADTIARILEGRPAAVEFAFEHLKAYESVLTGQRVTQVECRGKGLLIHFEDGHSIYSHNQLYGRWVTTRNLEPPKTNRQIRLRLSTARGSAWLLSASEIEVLDESGRQQHGYLSRLGPDPLHPETTAAVLREHWQRPEFRRRALAGLLLDQGFLAGVGNYLRSEILFVARLDPRGRLPADLQPLASATLALFRQSHATKGLTNDLELVAELKGQGWRRRDYRHWVFNRQSRPCHLCQTSIEKAVLAGRRLYWCPTCQKPS